MGLAFAEIDTSDGVAKRHNFNVNKDKSLVIRYTLDVSDDLVQAQTVIKARFTIERVPDLPDLRYISPYITLYDGHDQINTNKGDPGGYISWWTGLKPRDFWEGVYRFQVFAWVPETDIIAASEEWFFTINR